jgi:hypothetical protein
MREACEGQAVRLGAKARSKANPVARRPEAVIEQRSVAKYSEGHAQKYQSHLRS